MKPSSYTTATISDHPSLTSDLVPSFVGSPIRVAAKNKSRGKLRNAFMDDRGFPDQSDEYDTLLHDVDGGPILRKLKHPAPPLDVHDPSFHFPFDEALHGERLQEQLDLSHLDPSIRLKVTDLIKEFWSVFDERGVWVPVKNYECVIDTGNTPPIAIKNIRYGPKELPIMRKAIAGLEQVGHIRQIHNGR